MDDSKNELGIRYLSVIEASLPNDQYEAFLEWMRSKKTDFKIVRFDQAKMHEGRNPDMVRQNICGVFDAAISRMEQQ
jgi:hypothetical protein